MMRRKLLPALLLAAAVLPLSAQEEVFLPPNLYVYSAGPGPGGREERLLAELLILRLSRDLTVRLLEGELGEAVPPVDEEKTSLAAAAGADAWLELRAEPEGAGLAFALRLYVLEEERFTSDRRISDPGSVFTLGEEFWEALTSEVASGLPRRRQQVAVSTRLVETREIRVVPYEVGTRVTVRARPGTRISGLAPRALYADTRGIAVAEVPSRATYRLRAEHWRYLPESRLLYVGESPLTVELSQERGPRFAVEGLTHMKESLGFGVRYYPLPGIIFAGLRAVNSFQGLLPPYDFRNEDDRWFSRNLYLGFNMGAYLNSQNRRIRIGLAAGGFVRFYADRYDPAMELHPVFPYGLTLGPVFELAAGRRFALFVEWMPEFYFYIPFDDTLTMAGGPYEYMESFPWDDLDKGPGDIRINMGSAFFGVRYRF